MWACVHPQRVRPAVGVEQHRQWARPSGSKSWGRSTATARSRSPTVSSCTFGATQRRLGERGDLVGRLTAIGRWSGFPVGRAWPTAARWWLHRRRRRERRGRSVSARRPSSRPLPHVELGGVVDRVGAERDRWCRLVAAGRHDRADLQVGRRDRFVGDRAGAGRRRGRRWSPAARRRAAPGSPGRARPTRRRSRATAPWSRRVSACLGCRPAGPSCPADRAPARAGSGRRRSSRPRPGRGRSRGPSRQRCVEPSRPTQVQRDVGVGRPGGRISDRAGRLFGVGRIGDHPLGRPVHRRRGTRRAWCRRGSTSSRGSGPSPRRR